MKGCFTMLQTLSIKREQNLAVSIAAIVAFVVLTAISAKISIPLEPVPFTMQVLVVLLSGMALGGSRGLIAQLSYVGLIAAGLPIDARGLGSAALFGPTGGFLIGFVVAAFVVGWLTERASDKLWIRWIAGLVGVVVIYWFGATHLAVYRSMGAEAVFDAVVRPFVMLDILKAFIAAGLAEGTRKLLSR
jgi:biotin transport system substrate-specific component